MSELSHSLLRIADELSRARRLASALDVGIDGLDVATRAHRDGLSEVTDRLLDQMDRVSEQLEDVRRQISSEAQSGTLKIQKKRQY
jgi:hypothetical protein